MPQTETQRLQTEIKTLLKEVGWSFRKFAQELVLADEQSDFREDLTIERELAKLKKALTRSSTKPQKLHFYLNFLIERNKRRALYKVPMLDMSLFSEEERKLFEDIEEISKRVFDESD